MNFLKKAKKTCEMVVKNHICKADCKQIFPSSENRLTNSSPLSFKQKFDKAAYDILNDADYQMCVVYAKKKYQSFDSLLSTECLKQEEIICGVTNVKARQFRNSLDEQENKLAAIELKKFKKTCGMVVAENYGCKAECEQIFSSSEASLSSSAASLTTTVLIVLSTLAFLSK